MNSTKATARLAGLLYLLFAILAVFSYMYIPAAFVVPGDAAATVRKITEGELMYRIGIAASLVGHILFIFLVLALYELFKDVNKRQARLMVVLVCVGVAAEVVNLVIRTAPLVLSSGADFLSAFTKPQLDALALGSLRLGNNLGQLLTAFWGLWLFPFGIVTIKSGFLPRILGILLMVAGIAYVAGCFVRLVFPAHFPVVSQALTPLYFGELPIIFWLLIMGVRVPRAEAQPSHVS
jgi:hypothetical protein